jgi:hypothetical protein
VTAAQKQAKSSARPRPDLAETEKKDCDSILLVCIENLDIISRKRRIEEKSTFAIVEAALLRDMNTIKQRIDKSKTLF